MANIALDGLGPCLKAVVGRKHDKKGKSLSLKVHYVRYADDFIVTGCSKELLEQEIKPVIETFLKERGLTLSPEKTKVTHIDEGFDFLGKQIRKYHGILLIKPSKSNRLSLIAKLRSIIKKNSTAEQSTIIQILNPIIKGWTDSHHPIVAKAAFKRVDYEIWKM